MTRATKAGLVAGGVAVVAALVGLLLALGPTERAATPEPGASDPRPAPAPMSGPSASRPRPTVDHGAATPGASESPTRSAPGGTIIRDHTDTAPSGAPSPITRESVARIRGAVQPRVRQCGEPLRASGQRGRLNVTFTAVSSGGRVTVRDVVVKLTDIDDPAVGECVRLAFEMVAFPAPEGQGDGEHQVYMPFTLP